MRPLAVLDAARQNRFQALFRLGDRSGVRPQGNRLDLALTRDLSA